MLSYLGFGGGSSDVNDVSGSKVKPSVSLQTDKDVYRPGDTVFVTIEVGNGNENVSVLAEKLSFELKGVEKLDKHLCITQNPPPGSKERRGERNFLDSSTPSLISDQLLSPGAKMTVMVRAILPQIIPPSYKGAIRYYYYIKSTLRGRWMALENSQVYKDSKKDYIKVETQIPIQVWVNQKNNGLLEDRLSEGIVPTITIQTEIYCKLMDGDLGWTRANDAYDSGEDGYDSSRDEISSLSSYAIKGNLNRTFSSSLSLNSGPRLSMKETSYIDEGVGSSPKMVVSHLSAAVVSYDSVPDGLSPDKASSSVIHSQQRKQTNGAGTSTSPEAGAREPVPSEGFTLGRSYNIKLDDQVLLRVSPNNADSTYYFSDTIGGTLTFFHEEGARRCLEVTVILETTEIVDKRFVHPSRRKNPENAKIRQIHSDHHEVVADLIQTSFLFSIPPDGPMSFTTPQVSVQWNLKFEFLSTPKDVDLRRYEHPLLVPVRETHNWVLPITVHAPPPRTSSATQNRGDKLYGLEPSWIRS